MFEALISFWGWKVLRKFLNSSGNSKNLLLIAIVAHFAGIFCFKILSRWKLIIELIVRLFSLNFMALSVFYFSSATQLTYEFGKFFKISSNFAKFLHQIDFIRLNRIKTAPNIRFSHRKINFCTILDLDHLSEFPRIKSFIVCCQFDIEHNISISVFLSDSKQCRRENFCQYCDWKTVPCSCYVIKQFG